DLQRHMRERTSENLRFTYNFVCGIQQHIVKCRHPPLQKPLCLLLTLLDAGKTAHRQIEPAAILLSGPDECKAGCLRKSCTHTVSSHIKPQQWIAVALHDVVPGESWLSIIFIVFRMGGPDMLRQSDQVLERNRLPFSR